MWDAQEANYVFRALGLARSPISHRITLGALPPELLDPQGAAFRQHLRINNRQEAMQTLPALKN